MRFVWRSITAVAFCLVMSSGALAIDPGFNGEISYEHLNLPKTEFTYIFDFTNLPAPNAVPSKDENHDGDLDGGRLDLSLGGRGTFAGIPIIAGLKGYYAQHDDSQSLSCQTVTLAATCAHGPLFEPDPNSQQVVAYGVGSNLIYQTDLDVDTWGIALEGQSAAKSMTGAIDVKLGAGYRRIDTDLSINGRRVSGGAGIPIPFSLDEATDTGYLGGYIGAGGKLPLGGGFALAVDGDVGVYWAHTDYDGRYISSGAAIATTNLDQSLTLDRDTSAIIASLKVGLDKDFGAFRAGLFGRGEYYSYAPEMNYNDVEGVVAPVGGSNNGTSIGRGDAWTASFGGRVTVPFTQ